MSNKNLVPFFVPALSMLLLTAEDKKGSPLEEDEVLLIRDKAAVIMMEAADVAKMTESRGVDIDPENCWYDWQMLRRELGRKPDIDPGARFSYVNRDDEEYRKTIADAQERLPTFRRLIEEKCHDDVYALVKVLLAEPDYRSYIWLIVTKVNPSTFIAEIFELPSNYRQFKVKQRIEVSDVDVQDWMINDNGTLYGGYSLRYSRGKMDTQGQAGFDRQLGVTVYA